MKPLLTRYQCPKCGAGLSRTSLYPRWPTYELQFPSFHVPLLRICLAIVFVGFALGFVHVALAMFGVLAIGAWVSWHYFGALQCDECREYFISGQFAGGRGRVIPWRWSHSKTIARRAAVMLAIGVGVFLPIYFAQSWFFSRCSENCAKEGMKARDSFRAFQCRCIPSPK